MIKITNVRVPLNNKNYPKIIAQKVKRPIRDIRHVRLLKQSIDARRENIHYICSFAFECNNEQQLIKKYPNVSFYEPYHYQYLDKVDDKVLIVGSGPAGLFCGYVLAHCGVDVTIIDRGKTIDERVKDVDALLHQGMLNEESNIAFGEGGAGTFSDGKLQTGTKNKRIPFVLETFVKYGAPKDILYLAKPHIGTDYLRNVIKNMRQAIIDMGGHFEFETKYLDVKKEGQRYRVFMSHKGKKKEMVVDDLVLAIGHSARDTYLSLSLNPMLKLTPKSFAVGVRIEQNQAKINQMLYHQDASKLSAASYKLAVQTSEKRGVYTFCMCPGGYVVPSSSEKGYLCINGMSEYKRDGKNANSAILVTVSPDDFGIDDPLAGISFQRDIEKKAFQLAGSNYYAPCQKVNDYLNDVTTSQLGSIKSTYLPGTTLANLNEVFPSFINRNLKEGLIKMNKKMPGFIDDDTLLVGVETRSSSPVKIIRDENYHVDNENIYPIGEGAGMAGGIISSAIDGIMAAESILKNH